MHVKLASPLYVSIFFHNEAVDLRSKLLARTTVTFFIQRDASVFFLIPTF